MTGFHAHRHTSLLTRLRTHRLPRLVPAQHPETEARLLSAQVHLDVLVLGSWSDTTRDNVTFVCFKVVSSTEMRWGFLPEESTGKTVLAWPGSRKRCRRHPWTTNAQILYKHQQTAQQQTHVFPRKASTRQKRSDSALTSLWNFSIIHKSQQVLTACNIPVPYLQCAVGREHWSAIRGFAQRWWTELNRRREMKNWFQL